MWLDLHTKIHKNKTVFKIFKNNQEYKYLFTIIILQYWDSQMHGTK